MAFRPNRYVTSVYVSFETGEIGDIDVPFPAKSQITKLETVVIDPLAGTDAGTITAKNSADAAMAGGVVTIALSAAAGEKDSATPTTNNVVAAGDFARFTTAKTTAGGKANLFITYKHVP